MLTIRDEKEVDLYLQKIWSSAKSSALKFTEKPTSPVDLFRHMKFDLFGLHPIEGHQLNLVEQINQTWTFVAALEATRKLLKDYPNDEFRVAPGAHAATTFDIINNDGKVCAETFAAVTINNNKKLKRDLAKLERYPEIPNRYVFFMSPKFDKTERHERLERSEIQVWSIGYSLATAPVPASRDRGRPA